MERLEYDLLFRWFAGLGVDDAAWDQTTFGKNRDRLLAGDAAHKFLAAVPAHPKVKRLLSTDHFSIDGTLIEAWASMKSFRPKDGSGDPPSRRSRKITPKSRSAAKIHADHQLFPQPANRYLSCSMYKLIPQLAGQVRLENISHALLCYPP